MAKDKAVDSAVLDAGLTAIANAIREKTGGTDALAFPDAMAEAIAGIESGTKVATGSFTLTGNSTKAETVTHNLGETPNFAICFKYSNGTVAQSSFVFGCIESACFSAGLWASATYYFANKAITAASGYGARKATNSTVDFMPYDGFISGVTYQWYVGVI